MDAAQTHTWNEIQSQPEAWAAALQVLGSMRREVLDLRPARRFDQLIFTGCGSTYYLACSAAAQAQELTGLPCRALPASELWLYPRSSFVDGRTLLLAVSRSGETSETLRACEAFLSSGRGELATLSCYGDMPLASLGTLNLVFPSAQERSVAQTRAFSTLYLGTLGMACLWAERRDLLDGLARLPEAGQHLLTDSASLARELGGDAELDRFYWLGSGPRYGLACELSLKMKEMSLTHSEPFHFLEFRHGPKSMVTPSALVVGLRSTRNADREAAVLADVQGLGGRTLELSGDDPGGSPHSPGREVRFAPGMDEAVRNLLFLPVGQLIAFERSISKGLDPDLPNNLDTVVKL